MKWSARVRALSMIGASALMVTALAVPASAEEPDGYPGADPSLYTPPFSLTFPVEGSHGFSDTFGAIRDGGERLHQGNDIGAPKGTPVLAAADGVISRIDTGRLAGLYIEVLHADGWTTRYLHLNNDETPPPPPPPASDDAAVSDEASDDAAVSDGTDAAVTDEAAVSDEAAVEEADPDDSGPDEAVPQPTTGIPEGLDVGSSVSAGDVIGFVGTSGNAATTAPHLHFEVRMPDGTPVNPYPLLTGKSSPTTLYVLPEVTDEPVTARLDVVGHIDPGDGFNAAVAAHRGIAYLGTYGNAEVCPSTGVRRYDVADPAEPVELPPISDDRPGTRTEAIWVGAVDTVGFSGDLAIVAHAVCDTADADAFRGLVLYDVTDPAEPMPLGVYPAGPGTGGVSSFDVWNGDDRVVVIAAVPNSFIDHPDARGDVRIIDVTLPTTPLELATWDFRRDAPASIREAVLDGDDPRDFRAQGITIDPDGERVFVANWNAGVVVLELSDPSHPEFIGRDASMGYQEGQAGVTAYDRERQLLVVGHRDVDPLEGEPDAPAWGVDVILESGTDGDPTLVSTYSVEAARPDPEGRLELSGLYAPQDAVIADGYLYAVWLSGGLRVVSLSDPEHPAEVASFMPPTRVDPRRQIAAPNGNIAMPLAWSAFVQDDLIYVSDLNTGLWILRLPELPTDAE